MIKMALQQNYGNSKKPKSPSHWTGRPLFYDIKTVCEDKIRHFKYFKKIKELQDQKKRKMAENYETIHKVIKSNHEEEEEEEDDKKIEKIDSDIAENDDVTSAWQIDEEDLKDIENEDLENEETEMEESKQVKKEIGQKENSDFIPDIGMKVKWINYYTLQDHCDDKISSEDYRKIILLFQTLWSFQEARQSRTIRDFLAPFIDTIIQDSLHSKLINHYKLSYCNIHTEGSGRRKEATSICSLTKLTGDTFFIYHVSILNLRG